MVNFNQLLTLAALGSSMVSAVHIDFRRYADSNCDAGHHIRKTSDLHDTKCKTFSHHELGFHSFQFDITKHHDDPEKKDCRVVVYSDRHCQGEAVTYGDMKKMDHACGQLPFEGRSVKVECGKKKDPIVKTLTPMPQPKTHTLTHKPTVTVTHTHEWEHKPKPTLTVVPEKKHRHCRWESGDDEDEDWWNEE